MITPAATGPVPVRILFVDDDADIGEFISAAAQRMGFPCVATRSATAFMAAFNTEATLVMVDLVMPGMDGVELLRWLGQQRCKAGILLMSGMDKRVLETAQMLATSLGLTVVGRLQKPFRLAQLEKIFADCATTLSSPTLPSRRKPPKTSV